MHPTSGSGLLVCAQASPKVILQHDDQPLLFDFCIGNRVIKAWSQANHMGPVDSSQARKASGGSSRISNRTHFNADSTVSCLEMNTNNAHVLNAQYILMPTGNQDSSNVYVSKHLDYHWIFFFLQPRTEGDMHYDTMPPTDKFIYLTFWRDTASKSLPCSKNSFK